MDCTEGTLFYNSILSRIQGEIETQARTLYFKICNTISISLDDLIQEGMIGAWIASTRYDESKVKNEGSINGYHMKYARYAMLTYIQKQNRDLSLEAYLEVETERGLVQREIEDKPVKCAETPEHKRTLVLTALSRLAPKQKISVMTAFQIEDEQGGMTTEDDINMSYTQYHGNKCDGLKNLRTIISIEGLQVQNDKPGLTEECRKLLRQDPTLTYPDLMRLTGCAARTAKRARTEMKRMLGVTA